MRIRRLVVPLLALYAAFVLWVTLSPRMPGTGFIRQLVEAVLAALHGAGVPRWVDYSVAEFSGNILMFVPLGMLVALLIPRRSRWALLLIGTLFSASIELTQTMVPGRVSDVRDVIANSTGFLLGAAVAVLAWQGRRRRNTAIEQPPDA